MNIVSLFAGCGGLDLGFEQAGFRIIWANEYDKTIKETYELNHPNTILNTNDIKLLKASDIPDCDGIIGGPPCQPWSEGGKRLGVEDPRGRLFYEYIRIINEKKPKFFVIENVKGILDVKHKDSLNEFLRLLTASGYKIKYELLNAANYKIPQDRFRVFFIGIRKDLKIRFNFPNVTCSTPITLYQAIGDIIEEPRFFKDDVIKSEHPTRTNHDVYIGSYDSKYMARNRVRCWDDTSFTIQAQARNTPQHPQAPKMTYISPSEYIFSKGFEHLYRRLSVRECARIQTFPDCFKFVYNDIKVGYKMVGNAVPPRLAYVLALQINKAFSTGIAPLITGKTASTKQVPIKTLIHQYPNIIIQNAKLLEQEVSNIDLTRNLLISLIKPEITSLFINHSAKLYYTGKKFPSSIALNKLYYFMPYIKGKGIRDLYLIKIARIGTKQELDPTSNDDHLRLIFEIEFVKRLFTDYQPIHLNIWHTFTDTSLNEVLKISKDNDLE